MRDAEPLRAVLTPPKVSLRRVEVVVNPLAGGVGPAAAAEVERILADFEFRSTVRSAIGDDLRPTLQAAIDSAPDLLIVLAGDGTARTAASLCGADGPMLAPLAGGTLNMLPHALYGPRDWSSALRELLSAGQPFEVSGGEVDGRRFHVAAMLGAPALLARAREAMRVGQFRLALGHLSHAWRRAFAGRLAFTLDGSEPRKARALTLMCPLVSRVAADTDQALEVDVMDPKGAAEAFRLGFRTLASPIIGDWRSDPSVEVAHCRLGEAWSGGRLPAILDGEPMRLHKRVEIRFIPLAFRALALRPPETQEPQ